MVSTAFLKQTEENRQPIDFVTENGSQDSEGKKLKPLKAVRFSEIEAKPIEWLWNPFLARGTFNLMEGEEGLGKTFLTCAFATAIAAGKGLPGVPEDEHIEASNVLLISAEDSLSHVLKPRLESMNADCEKIIAIDEPFTLDAEGIFRLKMVLAEYEPRAVFIDPLFSYTGKVNLDRDSDIRTITDALKSIAETFDCCIVGIRHIGKSKGFGDARNAGLNGIGWRASARSVLLIGKNPENEFQKALCQTKNNLAPKYQKSIGFEIKESQFFWTGESGLTAETMLSQLRNDTGEERGEKQDAISFLKTVLSDGEKSAKDVQTEARQLGISEATLRRAKHALNVKSDKKGGNFGGNPQWFWKLETAEDVQNINEDAQMNKDEHLQSNHSNKTSYRNNLAEDVQDISFEHLHTKNEHLQPSKCSKCDSEMQLTEGGKTSFCPLGCESREANK
jgi:hypothetical protein